MPTNRTRRTRKATGKTIIPENIKKFLETGLSPPGDWDIFTLKYPGDNSKLKERWAQYKQHFLLSWIRSNPATRPWAWWEMEAPGPRKRLGGIGDTDSDSTAFGVSDDWVTLDAEEFYNDPNIRAIDPEDPPTFESEAAYLERHGLLSASEKNTLKNNKSAFEPVLITNGE